ncbi:MAG: hypothetical protein IT458_16110 [Planctomycetes bacterium]|nr:hypothetical protein [Planctomycetota bacterium]
MHPRAAFGLRALVLLAVLGTHATAQDTRPASAPSADPIAEALARVRAKPEEERWRTIDWRESLVTGLAEAKTAGKPVFLFTYDGTLDDGNC